MRKKVGVLALQGAFAEHLDAFAAAGADVFEIRSPEDLCRRPDAIVLPGGESTVQGKLLGETGLFDPLSGAIRSGLPVFATCAGLILLAEKIENDSAAWFGTLPVAVRRNAYGRQLGSFSAVGLVDGEENVPMTFIRAPSIVSVGDGVEILSSHKGVPTGVRCKNMTAFAWHPELSNDLRTVRRFLSR